MKTEARRRYWPDEEPDKEWVSVTEWAGPTCSFCGDRYHIAQDCKVRPITEPF
jgi:hypothetical protein